MSSIHCNAPIYAETFPFDAFPIDADGSDNVPIDTRLESLKTRAGCASQAAVDLYDDLVAGLAHLAQQGETPPIGRLLSRSYLLADFLQQFEQETEELQHAIKSEGKAH